MPNPNITPEQATAPFEAKLPETTRNSKFFITIGPLIYNARIMAENRLRKMNRISGQEQDRA